MSTQLRSQEIKVITKPGLPNWDTITPSTHLLVEKITLPAQAQALLLGCGNGAAGASLARQLHNGKIYLTDINYIALQMSKETLAANKITNALIHSKPASLHKYKDSFDIVIIDLPKGRKLLRRWLCESFLTLNTGGKLYLAGANQAGIQSAIKDAKQLFGNSSIVGYKKGNRLSVSTKNSNTPEATQWSTENGLAPGSWRSLHMNTPQSNYNLFSLPGVFSYERLDDGTQLLLSNMEVSPHEHVIDLGCGVGIIGIVAALAGAAWVGCVDTNLYAIAATLKNLASYNLTNASAQPSDVLSAFPDRKVHKIYTNPPFHAGAAVDYRMAEAFIYQSYHALHPGGSLSLVANKFIPYDRFIKKIFPSVDLVAENTQYQVWRANRSGA